MARQAGSGAERLGRREGRVHPGSGLADRDAEIDVEIFIQWIDAYAQGKMRLAAFYLTRFRDEFKPAFAAWIATKPLQNEAAPLSPFALPEYRLAATAGQIASRRGPRPRPRT